MSCGVSSRTRILMTFEKNKRETIGTAWGATRQVFSSSEACPGLAWRGRALFQIGNTNCANSINSCFLCLEFPSLRLSEDLCCCLNYSTPASRNWWKWGTGEGPVTEGPNLEMLCSNLRDESTRRAQGYVRHGERRHVTFGNDFWAPGRISTATHNT